MENNKLRFGMQPFWFWNGDMNRKEIVEQILEMKRKGLPGFMIHPRQGMEIPYMSWEYFDRVRLAVQTARECDMEVWIYDEYPYPSGICAGEVILDHPEFLCKRLKRVIQEVKGGTNVRMYAPWGNVILARAYRIKNGSIDLTDFIDLTEFVGTGYQQEVFQYSGLTEYNKKRYFTGDLGKLLCWMPPNGNWKIYLVTEVVMNHFKYFGNFIDTLNPEAIQYFITLTHERYKKQIGDEFGKTVKGFFTDEVTAFPDKEPWSPLLPGKVMERYGIDLISSLPALWEDMGELSSMVRYAYWSTATDCFIESYDKAIYEWCESNHLLYIGEKPILRSSELQYMHIPGIDAGHQITGSPAKMVSERYRSNGKMISSAAHFYDKPAALCEVGHSIGWGMTMQDLKWIFDWLAVQGVDFYVIHGFFYTTDGLKKHDAPPSAFFQMPWWEDASCLISYAERLGNFLRSLKRQVKILVMDPVTSAWTSNPEEQIILKSDFAYMQNRMLCEELDYYIIDPDLFAQGSVLIRQGKTEFWIHGEAYEVLVLPPMRNIEALACKKILEFASMGGKLGILSAIPYEKIECSDEVHELETLFELDGSEVWEAYKEKRFKKSKEIGNLYYGATTEDLINWLKKQCPSGWKITPLDTLGRNELPSIYGKDENGSSRLFLVNTSLVERKLEIYDPDENCNVIILDALESRVITMEESKPKKQISVLLDDCMEFSLSNSNAFRMATWTARLPDGQEQEVEVAPLIDQLEAGGFLREIHQKNYFGCPKELQFVGTQICYRTEFYCTGFLNDKESPIDLVMEPQTFLGEWKIRINGTDISEREFVQKKVYLHTNLAAEVTGMLKEGKNLIEVMVQADVSYGGMRNPLYLFGKFSVEGTDNDWNLRPLRKRGYMKNLAESGLPFFYGEIVFEMQLPSMDYGDEPIVLKLDATWLTDSVRLKIGNYETEPCAWCPYNFTIPGGLLKGEQIKLEIVVKTSAISLFEGQRFCRETHTYESLSHTTSIISSSNSSHILEVPTK